MKNMFLSRYPSLRHHHSMVITPQGNHKQKITTTLGDLSIYFSHLEFSASDKNFENRETFEQLLKVFEALLNSMSDVLIDNGNISL